MLFTTLALFETVRHTGTSNLNAAFFPQNDSSLPLLTAAMDFLIDICWEPVLVSVGVTSRLYDRRSLCEKTIKILLDAYKVALVEAVPVSFPDRNSTEQALGNLAAKEINDDANSVSALTRAAAKYVNDFMLFTSNFKMGKHLHLLVFAYNWLQSRMAYRFTVDESLELTAWQAVRRIEDASEREQGHRLLKEFESAWNEMKNEFQTYLDCAHAQMLGESDIPFVDIKQIRIGELLSQDSRDVVDLINRMLDGRLVRQQNDHLSSEHLRRILQTGDISTPQNDIQIHSINQLGCLSDELPEELDIRFLPRDRNTMPLATIAVSKNDQNELDEFILSHTRTVVATLPEQSENSVEFRTEVEVDAVAIARFIVMRFTTGRRLLRMERLRTPFLRRSEDLANLAMEVSSAVVGDSEELQQQVSATQRKPHQHLCGVANELESFWWYRISLCEDEQVRSDLGDTLSGISHDELKRLDTQLAKCTEAVGGDILLYLATTVEIARTQTPDSGQYETLDPWLKSKISSLQVDDFCKTNEARTLITIIKRLRIVSLPAICSRIVEWWEGQEFLFSDLGREFSQMLDDELVQQFHEMVTVAMAGTRDEVGSSLEVLQAVAETMLRDEFRRNIRLYGAYKTMNDVFRDEINLPKGPLCDSMTAFLRSRHLESGHYAHFMRLVRGACGHMSLYLRTMSTATVSKSSAAGKAGSVGYIEKVPEEFAIFQEILDFSAPVDLRIMSPAVDDDDDDLAANGLASRSGISDWEDLSGESVRSVSPIEIRLHPQQPAESQEEVPHSPEKPVTIQKTLNVDEQGPSDWIETNSSKKIDLEIGAPLKSPPPPPPSAAASSSATAERDSATLPVPPPLNESNTSSEKVVANKTKGIKLNQENNKMSVEKFAEQAQMSVEDINFLIQEGLLSPKNLPGVAGVRLQKSSLSLLSSLLVRLADKGVSNETVRILQARVMIRNGEECITALDWDRIQELAAQLQVRLEDVQYLHREGLLVLRYEEKGKTMPAGMEVDCRADESAVEGMIEHLQAALAAEEDVRAVQAAVEITDAQLGEALLIFGHRLIQYQGMHRVLRSGLEALIVEYGLGDDEMETDDT